MTNFASGFRLIFHLSPGLSVAFFAFVFSCLISALPVAAAETGEEKRSQPAVEFTKLQDISAEGTGDNRLVKQKWAVVVGASKFKENRLTPAEARDMDQSARDFYNYLIDEKSGRFAPGHVKLLINSSATRQNIMSALGEGFLGTLAGPDDLVIIYLATNAFPTTDGNTYLCAYDCALDNVYGTCISMQNLMDTLKKNVKSQRIVLVLQAAYSGAAELESGAKALYSGFNLDLNKVVLGKGYVILSSSRPNEITWGSSFSKNLVAALKQENGMIGLRKAFDMARLETERETAQKDPARRQTPVFKADWSGNDLVLGTPPLEKISDLPEAVLKFQSAESQYLAATKLANEGKIDEALKFYQLAVEINPSYGDALSDYAAALALKGDWSRACEIYARAVAAKPEDALYHLNYARCLQKTGKDSECIAELELAYRLNAKDVTVLQALSGRLLPYDAARSVRLLREALALYPKRASLHESLSYALLKNGEVEESLSQARESVACDPESASAQIALGSALMYSRKISDAVLAYRQAVKLSPSNEDAHYLLARALKEQGATEEAIAMYGRFMELAAPSDARISRAKTEIEAMRKK